MADPRAVVPYHDPHDDSLHSNIILNFGNDLSNPTLLDLSRDAEFSYSSSVLPQLNHDPYFSDPMMIQSGSIGGGAGNNSEAGPSELHGENHFVPPQNSESHSASASFWPQLPVPFTCTCCQVLRDIVHTNGIDFTKLQIHGTLGLISHAIHYHNAYVGSSSTPPFQIVDFSSKSIEQTKAFLIQYCLNQNLAGYFIVQDPLSSYYEALCSGLDWNEDSNDDLCDPNPSPSGGRSAMEQDADAGDGMERIPRTCLAEQRERSGRMKLSDLREHFNLPIEKASKRLKLCPTVLKKICRREGLQRWPHRKVKSIVKQIAILRRAMESGEGALRGAETEAQIGKLEQEMILHCGGFPPISFNLE